MSKIKPSLNPSASTGDINMTTETSSKYSFLIGLVKTAKNSAFLLIPFALALIAGVPSEYAWITGPVVYMLKNYYENKNN